MDRDRRGAAEDGDREDPALQAPDRLRRRQAGVASADDNLVDDSKQEAEVVNVAIVLARKYAKGVTPIAHQQGHAPWHMHSNFHAVVSGKTLTLPDLGAFEGKRVEVIVVEDEVPSDLGVAPKVRALGIMRGQVIVPDDFNDPLPSELQKYFEGDDEKS